MTEDVSSQQDKYKTLIKQTEATRFKPGQSGNPSGKPKTKHITDILGKLLDAEASEGKTNAEAIAEELIKLVKDAKQRGYAPMLKELLDRVEGKVPDTHKIESDVPINIIYKQVGDRDDA